MDCRDDVESEDERDHYSEMFVFYCQNGMLKFILRFRRQNAQMLTMAEIVRAVKIPGEAFD